jgi:hypothetical protein
MSQAIQDLITRLAQAQRSEFHHGHRVSLYWFRHYKQLAREAVALLSAQDADHKHDECCGGGSPEQARTVDDWCRACLVRAYDRALRRAMPHAALLLQGEARIEERMTEDWIYRAERTEISDR